jgi:hypothetical protein
MQLQNQLALSTYYNCEVTTPGAPRRKEDPMDRQQPSKMGQPIKQSQKFSLIRPSFFICYLEKSWCETSPPPWL